MARPRKNPITDPTGEKASAKAAANPSIGERAQEVAQAVGTSLQSAVESPIVQTVGGTVNNIGQAVNSTTNAVVNAVASTSQTLANVKQASQPLGTGYQGQYSGVVTGVSPTSGLALPELQFQEMLPSDLLHPQIQLKASEQELTVGLAEYAAGTRAQKLLQAGLTYVAEVGKTKQLYHKAEQSFVKAAIEEVKVSQELVNFDKQQINLDVAIEKREQANEQLKQNQQLTLAAKVETAQLAQKLTALENKRTAEIKSIEAKTADIVQRYLQDSVNNGG